MADNMNQPILITGGTQRLGLAIAEDLLNQNFSLIITYRTEKPAIMQLANKGAKLIKADFSTNQGILVFIEELKKETRKLRAIIHNASDWQAENPGTEYPNLFSNMMNVHVNAPYQINLECKDMLCGDDDFADIIHMTDFVQDKGSKKRIAYAASKAALHNLTLSFSALLAPRVKVNSIAPAMLMFNEWDSHEYRKNALNKSLLRHIPGPMEAVRAVNFILNSEFITGQVIHLNGGRHLL